MCCKIKTVLLVTHVSLIVDHRVDIEILGNERKYIIGDIYHFIDDIY